MSKHLNIVERFAVQEKISAEPSILAAALNMKTRFLELKDIQLLPNDASTYINGQVSERKLYGLNILFHRYLQKGEKKSANVWQYEMSIEYRNAPSGSKVVLPKPVIC